MTPQNAPFEVHPVAPPRREWSAWIVSVLLHTLTILVFLILRADPPRDASDETPRDNSQPIALTPPIEFQPPPDQARPEPVPERATPLGPDSDNPDALVPREQGPPTPIPDDPEPTPESPTVAQPPAPPAAPPQVPTPEDLNSSGTIGTPTTPWGRPSPDLLAGSETGKSAAPVTAPVGSMGRVGVTTGDNRAWRPSFPQAAGRCVTIPDLGRNPDGTPVLAAVMGRVFDNGRRPLAGAHLTIVGTPYSTFSDGGGNYRLEFDPRLLEQCRVQYVRVAADGYAGQSLTLSVGREVRSDDVMLRRR